MNKECMDFFKEIRLSVNQCLEMTSDTKYKKINRFYFIRTSNYISGVIEDGGYSIITNKGIEESRLKNMIYVYDHAPSYDDIIFGSEYDSGVRDGIVIGIDTSLYSFYKRINELDSFKELLEIYLIDILKDCKYKGKGMDKHDYCDLIRTELFRRVTPQEGYMLNHSELDTLVNNISKYSYEEYEARVFNETWNFEIMESAVLILEHIINFERYSKISKLGVMDSIIKENSNCLGYFDNIMIQYARNFLDSLTDRNLTFVTKDKYRINLINLLKRSKIKSFKNKLNHIPSSEGSLPYLDSTLETEESLAARRINELFYEQSYIGLVNKGNALIESINNGVDPKFVQSRLSEFKLLADRIKFLSDDVTVQNVNKLVEDTVKVINDKFTNSVNTFVI